MDNAVYDTIEKRSYEGANFKVQGIENQLVSSSELIIHSLFNPN